MVVLDDANVEEVAKAACTNRLINAGQICINSKRFIVHESIYDQFVDKVVEEVKANWQLKDPMDETCTLGP